MKRMITGSEKQRKSSKKRSERYQNLSEEMKNKKWRYACKRDLSEQGKQKERQSFREQQESLPEVKKRHSKI